MPRRPRATSGFVYDPTVTIQELPHGGGWIMVGKAWAARDLLVELPLWASEFLFRFRLCERNAFVLNFGHGHCF